MPAILRNTRLTVAAVWQVLGFAVLTTVFVRYFQVPLWGWLVTAFHDFSSVNLFAALGGIKSDILRSLPMILAWVVISIICYLLYLFFDYVWSSLKLLVPIEVAIIRKKNDIFDNLIILNFLVRVGILIAVIALIPLAFFVFQPISVFVASLVEPHFSDLVYQGFWAMLAMLPVWFTYFLIFFYVLALIDYEKNEIQIDTDHNPLLGDDDENESDE